MTANTTTVRNLLRTSLRAVRVMLHATPASSWTGVRVDPEHTVRNLLRTSLRRGVTGLGVVMATILVTVLMVTGVSGPVFAAAPVTHAAWLKQTHSAWLRATARDYRRDIPVSGRKHFSLRKFRLYSEPLSVYRQEHPYQAPVVAAVYVKPTTATLNMDTLTCTQGSMGVTVHADVTLTGGEYTLWEPVYTTVNGIETMSETPVKIDGGPVTINVEWQVGGVYVTIDGSGNMTVLGPDPVTGLWPTPTGTPHVTIADMKGYPVGIQTISVDTSSYDSKFALDGASDTLKFTFDESNVTYNC